MSRSSGFRFFLLVLLLAVSAAAALAQTPGIGAVRGRVLDESGAPVAGAEVTLTNQDTGFSRTARSDERGTYVLPELPVTGTYGIRVAKEGLLAQERGDIQLRAGQTAAIDVVLGTAAVEAAITVYGTAEGVQSDSPQLGTYLDAETIQATPVPGRKLTTLPLLNSAVRPARGTGDLFLNNTLFVINGGGRRQTTYTVDGGTLDDSWGRQTIFTNVPLGAIQEMTVLTNSFSAEYGRTTGGAINLVTRTGTNEVHGDVVALSRPGGIQSNAPVTDQESHDELLQGSAFFSGPLVRDRVYWALAAEYNDQDRDSIITSPLAPGVFTGNYEQTLLFGRLDADLNDANHLLGRLSFDHFRDTNPADAVGGVALPSAARTFRRETQAALLGDTAVLGPDAFNDARLVWEEGDPITEFEPVAPSPQFVRPGVSTEGESRSARLTSRMVQFADAVSLGLGDHFVKIGGDVVRAESGGNGQEFGSPFTLGQFTFRTGISPTIPTSQLTLNDVQRFTQGFGNVEYSVTETLWSAFVQDDYRIRPDLVLNLGLRYDRQSLTDDTDNFAPRLGFAWNPGNDPSTIVRGGYGIYYSEIRANIVAGWELNGPEGFFNFSAAPGQLGFPTSFNPLPGFPAGAVLPPRDITIRPGRRGYYSQFFDISRLAGYQDELLNPKTDQATLGVERRIGDGWFASLDYVHAHTEDIDRNIDLNAPTAFDRTAPGQVRPAATADATRPITPVAGGYRRILATINQGESKYDGAQLNLRKEFSGQGSLLLSYTWSHSRNNVEPDAPGGDPNDARQLDDEWADSLLDQRHRAVLSGWTALPWQFRLGGVATYASGRPYNITTGADNNGDGSTADRPVIDGRVIERNDGRGDAVYDLSLFLERDFSVGFATLGLRGEVFNVTDHENVVGYNGVYGNNANGQPLSTFGQPVGGISSVDPGRQYQFQARLRF
ncbi:MAG TPA: TonB-dependent receptor [Thermoanaerobaculia bacterium]|nr:TonB-dependent receptor [Thermoanaerobaculia bacterium]